jgi:hypothetical protein
MNKNSVIRSKRNPNDPTIPFLFYAKQNLIDEIKLVAEQNDMSAAQFLRQGAVRNLNLYKKATS